MVFKCFKYALDARLSVVLARCHDALYNISMFKLCYPCYCLFRFCHFFKCPGRICTNVLSTSSAPKLWLPFLAQYLCVMYNIFMSLCTNHDNLVPIGGGLVSPELFYILKTALEKSSVFFEDQPVLLLGLSIWSAAKLRWSPQCPFLVGVGSARRRVTGLSTSQQYYLLLWLLIWSYCNEWTSHVRWTRG